MGGTWNGKVIEMKKIAFPILRMVKKGHVTVGYVSDEPDALPLVHGLPDAEERYIRVKVGRCEYIWLEESREKEYRRLMNAADSFERNAEVEFKLAVRVQGHLPLLSERADECGRTFKTEAIALRQEAQRLLVPDTVDTDERR